MAYIRCKRINGSQYAYLVESTTTPQGPRQKVKKYLGKVHEFSERDEIVRSGEYNTKKELVRCLIEKELLSHGFVKNKSSFCCENVVFDKSLKQKNGKSIVLKINEGYLCDFTVKRILNFKKSDDVAKDAPILAKHFIDAGFVISEEEFVQYYRLL